MVHGRPHRSARRFARGEEDEDAGHSKHFESAGLGGYRPKSLDPDLLMNFGVFHTKVNMANGDPVVIRGTELRKSGLLQRPQARNCEGSEKDLFTHGPERYHGTVATVYMTAATVTSGKLRDEGGDQSPHGRDEARC